MSITIAARYDGQVLVPDRPLSLSVGQRVTLEMEEASEVNDASDQLWQELQFDAELSRQIIYSDGLLSVRGTRITVKLILEFAADGLDPAAIHERLPTANLAVITRLSALAQRPSEALRHYLQSQREDEATWFNAEHQGPSLEELRARAVPPTIEKQPGS